MLTVCVQVQYGLQRKVAPLYITILTLYIIILLPLRTHTYTHTALIETAYHPDNCYHNCTHASDVTQALHCLISEPMVSKNGLYHISEINKCALHIGQDIVVVLFSESNCYTVFVRLYSRRGHLIILITTNK